MAKDLRLGIDIGGTFTDFALVDRAGRRVAVHKQLTTPGDPSRAVIDGTQAILLVAGVAVADVGEIVHGTTLITNALIERRGARVGMLVTRGFRDLFDIGREQRYDLFDLRLTFAEPLVDRALRVEISERLTHDGSVRTPLDEDEVRTAVTRLVSVNDIEALAVCYLHSYADDSHERRTRAIVAEMYPGLLVSTSADVFPYLREFERWSTTCANAYAQPLVDRYLSRIEDGLAESGFVGQFWIMASGGGLVAPALARRYPVRLLESGPAAGVLMSARVGREFGEKHVLSFDLGGTTAKGALVHHGQPLRKYTFEAAHTHDYRSGSGLQLQIPVIDMTEIGAGGGSLVSVDSLGRLRVGPQSAGAEPGPACYGSGGTQATLTDANLLLGYLDAAFFLGGRMALDREAAHAALARAGAPLGLDAIRTAWGVHDIANELIARAFRMHATERGFDYRRCSMVAFGGGGPLHAARIARKLRVPTVIFPAGAGVMSAFGMLSGAESFEVMRAAPCSLEHLTVEAVGRMLSDVDAEASRPLLEAGLDRALLHMRRRVDMRYRGQGYDIEVALPDELDAAGIHAALAELFRDRYRDVFHATLQEPIEIVSWKVEASGPAPASFDTAPVAGASGAALKGTRTAFVSGRDFEEVPVYARDALARGARVVGPALVEENESTCFLDTGDVGIVDQKGNIVAQIGAAA